jgi:hypothetical protein
MNEATNRMDMNMFAQVVNLSPNQTMVELQELKTFTPVSSEMSFLFYVGVDKPIGFSASSMEEFYSFIKQVIVDSLEFHLYRGDFENWLKDVFKDSELAEAFGALKTEEVKGEDLRKALVKAIYAKYGVGDLL